MWTGCFSFKQIRDEAEWTPCAQFRILPSTRMFIMLTTDSYLTSLQIPPNFGIMQWYRGLNIPVNDSKNFQLQGNTI
jgi:hypothetical protein